MKLVMDRGTLACRYPGQYQDQAIVADISADGDIYVHYNPEIGNAIPMDVYHNVIIRIGLHGVSSKRGARAWYSACRPLLARIVDGLDSEWNGSDWIGTLTEDADMALDEIEIMTGSPYRW